MPLTFKLGPAALFKHHHAPILNVNELSVKVSTPGQRIADKVVTVVGSWLFIIIQSVLLLLWMVANVYLAFHFKDKAFDPYPFILLNLVLSFQAAYTGPVVMMSQNRQSDKDRLLAEQDFEVNRRSEEEIKILMEHLAHQDEILHQIGLELAELKVAVTVK